MNSALPPTIDPRAAKRWADLLPAKTPWLHEEVGRRMEERLQWIVNKPASWLDWAPLSGGALAHSAIAKRYPKAESFVVEQSPRRLSLAREQLQPEWWKLSRWKGSRIAFSEPPGPVEMIWANMALHMCADPQEVLSQWQKMLAVNGFLMFSCFGPDTLREISDLYREQKWPEASHVFTDMHDLGDMLVQSGFAEPVMDMERITLSYSSPESLLAELRDLGRNLHIQRFQALRGRRWLAHLHEQLNAKLKRPDSNGRLTLTFEIIYGHAFKPVPRIPVKDDIQISLDEMRQALGLEKAMQRRK